MTHASAPRLCHPSRCAPSDVGSLVRWMTVSYAVSRVLAMFLMLGVVANWPTVLRAQLVMATAMIGATRRGAPDPSRQPRVLPFGRHARRSVGTVRGTVTDSATHAPVVGATIVVNDGEPRAVTGMDGTYRLADVPVGTISLTVRRLGYVSVSRQVMVVADSETVVNVVLVAAPQMLDEVVTTGTVVPTEVKELPNPVSIVSSADIERQPVHRIDQLFRQIVPGSQAPNWDPQPQASTMSVRGASALTGSTGLKVYIDGIEVSNSAFAAIDPNSIERIEVIRGPEAAAIYGSGAIGGVMQIFTKHGEPGLARPQLDMQATLGMIQSPYKAGGAPRQRYTGTLRGGSETAGYTIGGGYAHDGAWIPGYYMSNPSAFGGVHLEHGPVRLDLSGRYYTQTFDAAVEPELLHAGVAYYSKPFYQQVHAQEETDGAHLTFAATTWWQHNLIVGVDRATQAQHSTRPRLTTPADTLLTVSSLEDGKISVAYNTFVSIPISHTVSATLTAGVDHYSLTHNSVATSGALRTQGAIATAPAQPPTLNYSVTTNTGYFAETQLNLHDALFLTAAIRGERNSDFGSDLGTVWSPRGGLSYVHSIGPMMFKARASYGEAIQPPGPVQKSAYVTNVNVQLENPLLLPERQVGGDGGVDLVIGDKGSFSVTYYDQTARDLIQSVRFTADTSQFQNVGEIKNKGWELEGALNIGPAQVHGQYAITNSTVEALGPRYTGDLHVGDQVLRIPRHTGGASVTLAPWLGTSVTVGLAYVGAWEYYDVLGYYRCLGKTGPCHGRSLSDYRITFPAFAKANLSLTQQITPAVTGLLTIENLTNKNAYEVSNIFPTQGRITTAGVKVTF